MGDLKYLLPILVAVILVWITYLVINFVATIIKTKKKETTPTPEHRCGSSFFLLYSIFSLVIYYYYAIPLNTNTTRKGNKQ